MSDVLAARRMVLELGVPDGPAWVAQLASETPKRVSDVCRWLSSGRVLVVLELLLPSELRGALRVHLLSSAPSVALVVVRDASHARVLSRLGGWVRCVEARDVLAMGSLSLKVDWRASRGLSAQAGVLRGRLACVRSDDAVFKRCPGEPPRVLAGELPGGYRVAYSVAEATSPSR